MPDLKKPGGLTVSDHDVAGERRAKRLKVGFITVVGLVVLVAGAWGAWYLSPPALPDTIDEANALVASARFQRLSKEDQRPYLDVIREQFGSLDPEERRAMRGSDAARAARGEERDERMAAYSVMTYEQRQAMGSPWGNRGDRQGRPQGERRGGGGESGRPGGEGGEGRGDRGPSRERLSDRMQNGSAQNMANVAEMVNQMREGGERGGPGRSR